MTPPAGPDSTIWAGWRAARAADIRPPFDCITWSRSIPAIRRSVGRQLEHVARHDRPDVGVDDGRARPLVLADHRQQVDRQRGVGARRRRAAARSPARGPGCGTNGAGRRRPPRCPPPRGTRSSAAPRPRRSGRGRAPSGPIALVDLEPPAALDERRRRDVAGVVQLGRPRAAQLEDVAEPGGRQQRGPGAATFEDRVGRDRRAVDDLGPGPDPAVRVEPLDDLGHGPPEVGRRRGDLVQSTAGRPRRRRRCR